MGSDSDLIFWSLFLAASTGGIWWEIPFLPHLWIWMVPPFSLGFVFFILYLISIVDDMSTSAAPLMLVYSMMAHHYGKYHFLSWLVGHPTTMLTYGLGYVAIGIAWTLPRMWLYLKSDKGINDLRRRLIPSDLPSATRSSNANDALDFEKLAREFLTNNKWRLYTWIFYWPFSMIHALCNDLFREIVDYVCNRLLYNLYLSMVVHVMKKIVADKDD